MFPHLSVCSPFMCVFSSFLPHLRCIMLDFYTVKINIGLFCEYIKASDYVSPAPLECLYPLSSQGFQVGFLCCQKKNWSIQFNKLINFRVPPSPCQCVLGWFIETLLELKSFHLLYVSNISFGVLIDWYLVIWVVCTWF